MFKSGSFVLGYAEVCSNGDTNILWNREQIQWFFPETQPAPAWLPRGEAPAEQGQAALTPLMGALSTEHRSWHSRCP